MSQTLALGLLVMLAGCGATVRDEAPLAPTVAPSSGMTQAGAHPLPALQAAFRSWS